MNTTIYQVTGIRKYLSAPLLVSMLTVVLMTSCDDNDRDADPPAVDQFIVSLEEGFKIEKVVGNLTFPTSVTWDDEGKMYVAEAGGGLSTEQLAPSRILMVEQDKTTEIANMTGQGVTASVVGLVWHDGKFFITHRADDLTGAVSSVTKEGTVTKIFDGIIDSQAEHQINDIRIGPDGKMYVAVGLAGNAGVIGPSVAPYVMSSPDVRPMPCQDIVLLGRNFKTADFRTTDTSDSVMTGAFMPFGTPSTPGQVIRGVSKCGGSILKFDPNNPADITTHAWGFRNLIGIAWSSDGQMYAAENGYDVRGSRPVNDDTDVSLRINEGVWYGIPDFSAGREPLTDPKFESPDSLQAAVFVSDDNPEGKNLGFVIDHQASGLTPPDPSVVLARHEINSSPSMIDVAPASWGDMAGHVFVAEWGDLAPPTNPLRGKSPALGYRIVRINPSSGEVTSFASNEGAGGPASQLNQEGNGLERPFDVQFGPDGALYIVDYGVVSVDMTQKPPYVYNEGTGAIWRISKK
jgi:glucose/arabinose dehydrogenase